MDDLTISQAYDEGLSKVSEEAGSPESPDGSKVEVQPEKEPDGAQPGKTEVKPEVEGKADVEPNEPGKPNTPDGKEEYTKERFDGLMSAWQKDRSLAKSIPELQSKIKELEDLVKAKQEPPAEQDDLPPEIQNADPETQAGYRLLMKANDGKLSKLEENIVHKIMDKLSKPVREEAELVTKVQREVEELSVEFGKDFADNIKDVKKFAADNNYPIGTLRHAYQAWSKEKELEKLKGIKSDGKKVLDEIENKNAEKGNIPIGSANRSGETPKWDEKRDGNKSLSDIFEDVKTYI